MVKFRAKIWHFIVDGPNHYNNILVLYNFCSQKQYSHSRNILHVSATNISSSFLALMMPIMNDGLPNLQNEESLHAVTKKLTLAHWCHLYIPLPRFRKHLDIYYTNKLRIREAYHAYANSIIQSPFQNCLVIGALLLDFYQINHWSNMWQVIELDKRIYSLHWVFIHSVPQRYKFLFLNLILSLFFFIV